jgi:3-phytase
MGKGIFQFQAEGIALYDAGDGEGLWICTDQGKSANYFHLFDRRSLAYVGTFSGPATLNTDGIWLAQFPVGKRYPQGLFLAVHNDGNVAAFDFADILKAFAAR